MAIDSEDLGFWREDGRILVHAKTTGRGTRVLTKAWLKITDA